MIDVLMIVSGLVLLFFGGEALIRGSVSLARNFGLSQLLVSAVIVGFGTSMPEMTVSVGAAFKGSPEIAVGNVVGSNIANILLIVGVAALIAPILITNRAVRRDTAMMLVASLMLWGLALTGTLQGIAGIFMFATLLAYIAWSYGQDRKAQSATPAHIAEDLSGPKPLSPAIAALFSLVGLVLLVGGAWLLVEGAISIARSFGIAEAVIGLTIVAVGTSLPELATSVVAALRRHSDVIVGNILGSNIFNILAILGITSMVSVIPVSPQIASFDIPVMLAVAFFFAGFLWFGLRLGRLAGVAMITAYMAYTIWLYVSTGA